MASKVVNRIGTLKLSQQQFTKTKLLYLSGKKQPKDFLDYIGADVLYDKYHSKNEVKNTSKNIYTSTIPLAPNQFFNILDGGNFITDQVTGESLEILTFEWINETRQATINYAVKSNFGFNTYTKHTY